jgi:GTP-binding protein
MTFLVPTRGLIGLRTEMLTETRGTAVMHQIFEGWEPWQGTLRGRANGSLVADRAGTTTTFALMGLQERGRLFVGPGEEVYEGAIVGEHQRADDLDVNPTREKKLTNIRSSTADELVRLDAHRSLSLDEALEWVGDDECVEVTPSTVRVRKLELSGTRRAKTARRERARA